MIKIVPAFFIAKMRICLSDTLIVVFFHYLSSLFKST